jgi:ribonucleoside-diphosphate reductase beta chain
MILDPGFNLTLRPMKYPDLYDMYRDAIKNTWTVEEVDFSTDIMDLREKMSPGERHLIQRLVAFFATGDSIVANNLVLNFYQHVNSPEGRLYLSRQLFEEAVHVQFYLTLLDSYIPDPKERNEAFAAVSNIPSIRRKAEFSFQWMDSVHDIGRLKNIDDRRRFLKNLICFAACNEGMFFYAAFAYVYYLRSKGLLHGLATGTNWVFRDESMHMAFAFRLIDIIREEEPGIFDAALEDDVRRMIADAIDCETAFANDVLAQGVSGLSVRDMRQYLEFVADRRFEALRMAPVYNVKNPFPFLDLQDVQEVTNFFERRVSSYQVGIEGDVAFNEAF